MKPTFLPASLLIVGFAVSSQAQTTPVTALQNLAHTAESLERTVPFYRDVIGLPVNGASDPLAAPPQALDEDMSKFTATKGMKFRAAIFRIPNAAFGFELTEFTGETRKSGQPQVQDIGAALLALEVRDIDKMVAKLKAAGTTIVTAGGAPVTQTKNPSGKSRNLLIRDPDGFFVAINEQDPLPAAAANIPGDILGGSVWLSVEDTTRTVTFLKDAVGFNVRAMSPPQLTNPVTENYLNLPGVQYRITFGRIPDATMDFALIEYSGVPRARFLLGAEDSGSPAFTMVVRDIDSAVDRWVKAGGTVVTTGGKAIKRANGAGNVFVRDVNGFMWELIQRAVAQ
jgi:predicted enzyme related to lactoylglutathione lyase